MFGNSFATVVRKPMTISLNSESNNKRPLEGRGVGDEIKQVAQENKIISKVISFIDLQVKTKSPLTLPQRERGQKKIPLLLVFFVSLFSCSDEPEGSTPTIFERCNGKKISIQFEASIPVGSNGNRLFELNGQTTLIVESGQNTVSQIRDGQIFPFIDVGQNRNPWSVWGDSKSIYVTNYASDSISVFSSDGILKEEWTKGFSSPSSIIGDSKHVYISNVAFDGTIFQQGFTTIYDRDSKKRVRTLESSAQNPLFLSFISHQDKRYLGVTNAGSFEFTTEGTKVGSAASFELWNLDDLNDPVITTPLPLDPQGIIGSPGRPIQIEDSLFFISASQPVLFEYSLEKDEWTRGIQNPIRLRSPLPEALHFSSVWEDLIFVSAFNEDAMYIYDPMCEKVSVPISLDDNVDYLAGPHDISISEAGKGSLILSLANLVTPFTIENIND